MVTPIQIRKFVSRPFPAYISSFLGELNMPRKKDKLLYSSRPKSLSVLDQRLANLGAFGVVKPYMI
jgi:hypothetical protein